MKLNVVQAPTQQFLVLRERVELMVSTILALLVAHTLYMKGETHGVVSVRTGWKGFFGIPGCISCSIAVGGVLLEVFCLV